MANFTACVRGSIQDVAGLLLSLDPSSMEEAPTRPGFLQRWRNLAAGLPSQPMYRSDPNAAPSYRGGRFGNAEQFISDRQPQLVNFGGPRRVRFTRSRSTHLRIPIPSVALPSSAQAFTSAWSFTPGPDASVGQTLYADNVVSKLKVTRSNGSGNATARMGAGTLTHTGDIDAGRYLLESKNAAGNFQWSRNASSYQSGATPANFQMTGPDVACLGGDLSSGGVLTNALDGYLDSFHLWARGLSAREADFVWQTLGGLGAPPLNTQDRCTVTSARCADRSGNLSAGQVSRLNPVAGVDPVYKRAQLPAGGEGRVQIAMAVDGLVVPDSLLSGHLFSYSWIEVPGNPPAYPAVEMDSGWSSVLDVVVNQPGHYALSVFRASGGSLIIHFDVVP